MEPVINPFGYGHATKIVDENRKSSDWWGDYLAGNEPVIENEFYVLFEDGMLVKKGKSKFSTSQYIKGERFKRFRAHYESH